MHVEGHECHQSCHGASRFTYLRVCHGYLSRLTLGGHSSRNQALPMLHLRVPWRHGPFRGFAAGSLFSSIERRSKTRGV